MRIGVMVGMFPKLSETFIVNQVKGLIDRGHDASVIAMGGAEKEIQSDVVSYRLLDRALYPDRLPAPKLNRAAKFARDWFRLAMSQPRRAIGSARLALPFDSHGLQQFYVSQLFGGRSFDLIHCHFGFMGRIAARLAARGLIDCPFVTSYHGTDVGADFGVADYRELHARGTHFTANSEFSVGRAIALGCPADRIARLPVGVDLSDFRFSERRYQPPEPLRLLSVGRLVPSKGVHLSIEAVRELVAGGLEVRFDIVGDGPLRGELKRRVEDAGIGGAVRFHGALLRERIAELHAKAHLFVLSSIGMEGQGLVLQEAQACGIPVIASRCCGIPEGVIDGETGWLFPEGDAGALAACVRQQLAAHRRWPEVGRNGRALVERDFDIEKLNDQLVEIYRSVAGRCGTTATAR